MSLLVTQIEPIKNKKSEDAAKATKTTSEDAATTAAIATVPEGTPA